MALIDLDFFGRNIPTFLMLSLQHRKDPADAQAKKEGFANPTDQDDI